MGRVQALAFITHKPQLNEQGLGAIQQAEFKITLSFANFRHKFLKLDNQPRSYINHMIISNTKVFHKLGAFRAGCVTMHMHAAALKEPTEW